MTSSNERLTKANEPSLRALEMHRRYHGKMQTMPKCPIDSDDDFAVWYTPGVAEPCRAIAATPSLVADFTNRQNTVAILSDGSRVLGLGNIGAKAGLPVMEGKALLFKFLGGVDAVPLCLASQVPEDIVQVARLIEPTFGGLNLEDIAQPKCFRVLDRLTALLSIPVWHDDQQGTATAAFAGLLNALKVVNKSIGNVRIVLFGVGAANVAVYRLLTSAGVEPGAVIACDSRGLLHDRRSDIDDNQDKFREKWQICTESNADGLTGEAAGAFVDADVCIAFSQSGPSVIRPEWITAMARDPIVFACANPVPEIWPWEAEQAGATIVATGRGDFANQLNNALVFPGLFRGVLDVQANAIPPAVTSAAAQAMAAYAERRGLSKTCILPTIGDRDWPPELAAAVGVAAQDQAIAATTFDHATLRDHAAAVIEKAQADTRLLGAVTTPDAAS